jgi:hypothetical protein
MTNVTLRFLLVLGLTVSVGFGAEPANIRIDFMQPQRFTDFRIQNRSEMESTRIFSTDIIRNLSPVVARRFPGATLSLRFTDIDLAGRYEPWRGPQFDNVRFINDYTGPLKLSFDYQLIGPKRELVASGSKTLVDNDFQRRFATYAATGSATSSLFYEKAELRAWFEALARK